ncbi:uncharacterized protein LOC127833404 [Dreissena polymorpha]|uniref:Conodipine-M alpha chain n=1 Tax=Dreissena polymorpha TaxID=45954 RepID=A0A9D4G4D6_DREPO|nr:uncharacterized protein LOC127833404 [Dreissena polymorpha]KAH3808498.1 hypothetical protein DPMN_136854 [Dreissena polymorpha]
MKIVMVLTTAVMLMDLNIYADACKPPTNFADGCSGVADFKFTDDCNKHDICYACGNGRGVSRQSCDKRFYNNMLNTCNTKQNWFLRPGCKMMAWIYYKAVRDWGWKRYQTPSKLYCKQEAWVPACM